MRLRLPSASVSCRVRHLNNEDCQEKATQCIILDIIILITAGIFLQEKLINEFPKSIIEVFPLARLIFSGNWLFEGLSSKLDMPKKVQGSSDNVSSPYTQEQLLASLIRIKYPGWSCIPPVELFPEELKCANLVH